MNNHDDEMQRRRELLLQRRREQVLQQRRERVRLGRLSAQRQVDETCRRLRHNDPELTVIGEHSWLWRNDAYSRQVSQALEHNTVVEELTLEISDLMSLIGANGLATCIERNPSLRKLKLRSLGTNTRAAVDKLLLAAERAGKLVFLELHCQFGIRSVCSLLQSATPLKRLCLHLFDHHQVVPTIALALRGHQSIRELEIHIHKEEEEHAKGIANLLQNSRNAGIIQKLKVKTCSLQTCTTILRSLVGHRRTLRELRLCLNGYLGNHDNGGRQVLWWTQLADDIVPWLAPQLEELHLQRFPAPEQAHVETLVEAFKNNTSLTTVCIPNLDPASTRDVHYYCKRNKYRPLQDALEIPTNATIKTQKMLALFGTLHAECADEDDDVSEVSVIYDTLRARVVDILPVQNNQRPTAWQPRYQAAR